MSRSSLWWLWTAFGLVLAGAQLAMPRLAALQQDPWHPAQTAVAGFVLALLSLTLGVSSFALREKLRDVEASAPAGSRKIRNVLVQLWMRCLVIGGFGCIPAYGAALPSYAWPFAAAAAALLVLHAPRRGLLERPSA